MATRDMQNAIKKNLPPLGAVEQCSVVFIDGKFQIHGTAWLKGVLTEKING